MSLFFRLKAIIFSSILIIFILTKIELKTYR